VIEGRAALLEVPRRLPPVVAREVIEHRAGMLAAASGHVLDLALVDARAAVHGQLGRGEAFGADVVPSAAGTPAGDREYDLVISTVSFVFFADLVGALRVVRRRLAPTGELWFVEPTHHPGMWATVIASMWAGHPAVQGWHVERDVPAAVRAAGFVLTALKRFDVPTTVWPLRRFVQGVARHDPEAAR
jgi:SAM-dependent methyltransferase